MKSYDEMEFNPGAERLVQILCDKTQNNNPLFFRVMVAYYFSLVASMMRTMVVLPDGDVPVNMYAIALATSGAGKGKSTNVMEDKVIDQFRFQFTEHTMPHQAKIALPELTKKRLAGTPNVDPDKELASTEAEYDRMGPMFFSFDSGTAPAIKDVRHKLLMANCGSLNLQIDEIGTNLTGVLEILAPYLELYDVGKIKQKLTKNTSDNKRVKEIHGMTPANLLAFGTPSRLLDGGQTEQEFYTLLDTGYARRCFFAYATEHTTNLELDPTKVLAQRKASNSGTFLEDMSDAIGDLADPCNLHRRIRMGEAVQLLFIEYEIQCKQQAMEYREHEEMKKAEVTHRHFKAMKLAGVYAFMQGSPEITEQHAYQAIKLAEESGMAFLNLLARDRAHVKLAKYVATVNTPLSQHDLIEDLPFYKGTISHKNEMMQLAIAYGYQNNIIIKKRFEDGIEFLTGETLQQTDLDNMVLSHSNDLAYNYQTDTAPWDKLHLLTQLPDKHWCNHGFDKGHRSDDNAVPGFNMVVLDCDGDLQLSTAQMLLQDYRAMFYTTKRHTDAKNRFRVILPINYRLELDSDDYKEFMRNLFDWLPFKVDEATGQRSKKWMSNPGIFCYQEGKLLDCLPFIPKTSKNEEYRKQVLDQEGMNHLERWVINNIGDGNRNNILLRFAMILVDAGLDFQQILDHVTGLNNKIRNKLTEAEILTSIMVTVTKAIAKR